MASIIKYVDPVNGNDGNSGDTPGAAWQTLPGSEPQMAADTELRLMRTGDFVLSAGLTLSVIATTRQTPVRWVSADPVTGDATPGIYATVRADAPTTSLITCPAGADFRQFDGIDFDGADQVTSDLISAGVTGAALGLCVKRSRLRRAAGSGFLKRGSFGSDALFYRCAFSDLGGQGLEPSDFASSRYSNIVAHGCRFSDIDGAAVGGWLQQDITFAGNIVERCGSGITPAGAGTPTLSNVNVSHSVFYDMRAGDCVNLDTADALFAVYNNVFHTATGYCLNTNGIAENAGGISHNCYFNPAGLGLSDVSPPPGEGNVLADPGFVDFTDYLLSNSSPCIGAGILGGTIGLGVDPSAVGGGSGRVIYRNRVVPVPVNLRR